MSKTETTDNTSAKVEEIRERLKDADREAPYPWAMDDTDPPSAIGAEVIAPECGGETIAQTYGFPGECDARVVAAFIAHAPEDIAFLLDRVKELREERDGARAEIVVLEWERDDAREGVTAWGRARDVAEARRVALQGVVDRLTRENARLEEERDALRAEVERLKAMTQPKETLSCPDCEWSGQEVDLIQKMSGALCPSCSRVLRWLGGLRVSVAEVKSDLRPLMVEGWEMPEAPHTGSVALARRSIVTAGGAPLGHAWEFYWGVRWGFTSYPEIPWPFREGVTVTTEMLRALGFVVEEG